jgi:HEAT repeat protein
MFRTKSLIGCVWIGLLLFLPACRSKTDVEKDAAAAIGMLSKMPEADVAGVLKAVELMHRHPQKEALPALIPYLDDAKPARRRSAVHLIQTIHWDDGSPAFSALRQLLVHSEALTRGMSGMALASLGDGQCFDALVRMLEEDDDPYARRCAAWALGELKNQKAMGHLKKALNDSNALVKANAQNAIERLSFRLEFQGLTDPAMAVYEGVWLISGSNIAMETRIRRAVAMIRAVEEPIRRPILENLKSNKLASVRNSVVVALSRI